MTGNGIAQLVLYCVALTVAAVPLGLLVAHLIEPDKKPGPILGVVERGEGLLYRLAGVDPTRQMNWRSYAFAVLMFNLFGSLAVYLIERLQGVLPLNPLGLAAVEPGVAFNTAVSFATNTNWQAYGGESTMSFATQMLGLTTQNFVSAATGIAVMFALARGFARRNTADLGNFWVDLVRTSLRVLLPFSFVFALILVWQGMPQTLDGSATVKLVDPIVQADGANVAEQQIALGPVASQVAIKQLGTNGGGFYNVNSAHPLENPTPLSNFLEMLAILIFGAALCFTWGRLVKDARQGIALFAAMMLLYLPFAVGAVVAEQGGNPILAAAGVDQDASALHSGGNMEGKEVRFGITNSAIWAASTTAASNGSVNSMHDSYTPLGGLVPMVLMQLGEVVFGGVGSGLYGMILFAIVAVFIAGLMVGRTPEYLGKKIESFEVKMAIIGILVPCALVLAFTAISSSTELGYGTVANPAAHGFSEMLYAYSSGANNNGSAFAGITVNTPFWTSTIGIAMWAARYWIIVAVLAIAGSLAQKKLVPASTATFPTHGPLFIVLLAGTVILVGALTFIPALALGPIVEHLQLFR